MKKLVIAGNWKLHKTSTEVSAFLKAWWPKAKASTNQLVIFPSAILIPSLISGLKELGAQNKVEVGPQNICAELQGAFTGETSVAQAKELGCQLVLIGHSERRQIFGESDQLIQKKVQTVLSSGLKLMLCVGETLQERESGKTLARVREQLSVALNIAANSKLDTSKIFIAYEPVWAIGTGKVASPAQAEEVHLYIREQLKQMFGNAVASVPILYGGSVKPDNANELAAQKNIDGFLIGGASLKPDDFAALSLTKT